MEIAIQEDKFCSPKLKVVGVGGGGIEMLTHIEKSRVWHKDIEFLHISTPEDIRTGLKGADFVFIALSGDDEEAMYLSSMVAKEAKGLGALKLSVVAKPTKEEDKFLAELKKESDAVFMISNHELLGKALDVISLIMLYSKESDINIDYVDLRTIMHHKGLAFLNKGKGTGDGAALEAVKKAIFPLYIEGGSIKGANGIIMNFKTHPSCPIKATYPALSMVHDSVAGDADVIFGLTRDVSMGVDSMEVAIFVTGVRDR